MFLERYDHVLVNCLSSGKLFNSKTNHDGSRLQLTPVSSLLGRGASSFPNSGDWSAHGDRSHYASVLGMLHNRGGEGRWQLEDPFGSIDLDLTTSLENWSEGLITEDSMVIVSGRCGDDKSFIAESVIVPPPMACEIDETIVESPSPVVVRCQSVLSLFFQKFI